MIVNINNYENNKEYIRNKLQEENKKLMKSVLKIYITIFIFFGGLTAIIMIQNKASLLAICFMESLFGIVLLLAIFNARCDTREYNENYLNSDLSLIQAAFNGDITCINDVKIILTRNTEKDCIVETAQGEKIVITNNSLITISIYNGDKTSTVFNLDELHLSIYI